MSDLVTVPSMSVTTIRAELLTRCRLAAVLTTLPELVSTLYTSHLYTAPVQRLYCTHLYTSWFCPGWRPSCASCAAVAVVVRCLGSGSLIPSSADQNLAGVQSFKWSTGVIILHELHLYWPDPSSRARVEKYPRPALSSTMLTGTSRLLTWRLTTCPDRGSQMSFLPGAAP